MASSPSPSPSPPILLRYLHYPLRALRRLYQQPQDQELDPLPFQSKYVSNLKGRSNAQMATGTPRASPLRRSYDSGAGPPPDPNTEEEGLAVLHFVCRELGMGPSPLLRWRQGIHQRALAKWVCVPPTDTAAAAPPRGRLEHVARGVPLDVFQEHANATAHRHRKEPRSDPDPAASCATGKGSPTLYFYPREQDARLIRSCLRDLKAVLSPFITLSPPPRRTPLQRHTAGPTAGSEEEEEAIRPLSYATCSTFYATKHIPPGMFLFSLPTAAGFFADPPLTAFASAAEEEALEEEEGGALRLDENRAVDEINNNNNSKKKKTTRSESSHPACVGISPNLFQRTQDASSPPADPCRAYFMQVDDLVGQMCFEDAAASPWAAYLQYLQESVVPCRNLPFIQSEEALREALLPLARAACHREGRNKQKQEEEEAAALAMVEGSAALALWRYFHQVMGGRPISPALRRFFLGRETDAAAADAPSGSGDGPCGASKEEEEEKEAAAGLAAYHWWVSLVLSRRLGASCMMPLVDKLNHSPLPNCYYVMSVPDKTQQPQHRNEYTTTGIDVVHNLLAGVPLVHSYEPYLHVFAIRDIYPGEALTLCYQSAPTQAYRPASSENRLTSMRRAFLGGAPKKNEGKESKWASSTPPTTPHLLANAHRLSLRHPGVRHVDTVEGRGAWLLQWGFVPEQDAMFSQRDLEEMAVLLAEKRIEERQTLFPPSRLHHHFSSSSPPQPDLTIHQSRTTTTTTKTPFFLDLSSTVLSTLSHITDSHPATNYNKSA
eukprot:gene13486-9293_t